MISRHKLNIGIKASKLFLVVTGLLFLNFKVQGQARPIAFILQNNQPCDKVYGQPDFVSNGGATSINEEDEPYQVAVDRTTGKVFISDTKNHRVLRFANIDHYINGEDAEAVLGQNNFTTNGNSTTQNTMDEPEGIFVGFTGILWVCDQGNERVLRFDNASAKLNGANADGVLGQVLFTTKNKSTTQNEFDRPMSVFEENDGTLWVADSHNERILRFDNAAAKANGANADGVLGKPDFVTNGDEITQSGTARPSGVSVNNNGRLYVADERNNRIIWWDNAKAKANGANADGYLGQPNWTTNGNGLSQFEFEEPTTVSITPDNRVLTVGDLKNNRVMIYIDPGLVSGEINADFVFGQPDFTSNNANNGGLSASSMDDGCGVFIYRNTLFERFLFAADKDNNRTKLYRLFDVFFTNSYTPVIDTLQATEVDGDVLTYTVIDSTNLGGIVITDPTTGEFTYTPIDTSFDYIDSLLYEVCDVDGCDTSVVYFHVLAPKVLWVKADSGVNGASVAGWFNQVPNGDSLYANSGNEPTFISNSINFNPSISFDGTNDNMYYIPGIVDKFTNVHVSTYIVAKAASVKNHHLIEESIFGGNTYGNINVYGDGDAYFEAGTAFEHNAAWGGVLNTPYVWSFVQTISAESISRNALDIVVGAGGNVLGLGDTAFIGLNTLGNYYDGEIAEIIHFKHSIGDAFSIKRRNTIESYLGIKYGITLDQTTNNDGDATLGTDYTLFDTLAKAWEDADANGYIHDIAGIGRDDENGLNQKQSKSVNTDALITIGLDSIYADNQSNPNAYTKDTIAMMWSNDNGSLASWGPSAITFGYNDVQRIGREWKIEENLGDVGQVEIQVNDADLPASAFIESHLFVVVDEDGNGDFTDGNLRLVKMTKTAGVWNAFDNFADGEIFTFIYIKFDFMRHGKFFLNKNNQEYHWINRE